jgi:hypothetical protein
MTPLLPLMMLRQTVFKLRFRYGGSSARGMHICAYNDIPECSYPIIPAHQLQPPRSALPVRFFRYNLSGLGIGMQPFGLYYCGAPTTRRPEMRATRATSLNAPRHTSDSDILACSRFALSRSRLLRIPGRRNRSAVYLLMYWCIPAYKPTRLGVLTSRFHASMLEALALAPTREQAPFGTGVLPYQELYAHGPSGTIRSASDGLQNRRELERYRIQPCGVVARCFAEFYLTNGLCHRARHTGRRAYTLRIIIESLRPIPTPDTPPTTLFTTLHAPTCLQISLADLRQKIEAMDDGGRLGFDISRAEHTRQILNLPRSLPFLTYRLPPSQPHPSPSLPWQLYEAAGTRIASRSLYALPFALHEFRRIRGSLWLIAVRFLFFSLISVFPVVPGTFLYKLPCTSLQSIELYP